MSFDLRQRMRESSKRNALFPKIAQRNEKVLGIFCFISTVRLSLTEWNVTFSNVSEVNTEFYQILYVFTYLRMPHNS